MLKSSASVRITRICAIVCLLATGLVGPSAVAAGAKKTRVTAPAALSLEGAQPVLWQKPTRIREYDFVGGPGGRDAAPAPPFRFLEEDTDGSQPKVKVEDARGVKWSVKFGHEAKPENFGYRLVNAVGYFAEPSYVVRRGTIVGAHDLHRAKDYIGPRGEFADARFKRSESGVKKLDGEQSWGWESNPFVGTHELDGLKVMLMLLSNFDNKDVRDAKGRGSNTAIILEPTARGTQAKYVFTDWGGAMGKWGNYFTRSKYDCEGFAKQTRSFVKGVKDGYVEFGYSGQHTGDATERISVADVAWLLQSLGRITDAQIRTGLVASGFTPEEVNCYTASIRQRITELQRVAGSRSTHSRHGH